MGIYFILHLIIRVLLIAVNSYCSAYLMMKGTLWISFSFSILILILQVVSLIVSISNQFNRLNQIIDSFRHEDYSVSKKNEYKLNSLYDNIYALSKKLKKESIKKASKDLVYDRILETLNTGILVLKRSRNKEIEIFHINEAFSKHFKIPRYTNWKLLKRQIDLIDKQEILFTWKNSKRTIELVSNTGSKELFFLNKVYSKDLNFEYLLVSLETIQQIIDRKEKESWYNLMLVMSHEIINTITPIASLSESLNSQISNKTIQIEELETAVQIIEKRSRHLITFIDSYRKLTDLPTPSLVKTNLTKLLEETVSIFQGDPITGEHFVFDDHENIYGMVDPEMLEHALINLISNSIAATKTVDHPKIVFTINQTVNATEIHLMDNGTGISQEVKNKVFIPYFSTKENGQGIGLTLSKNIIEAHKGKLSFQSGEHGTEFRISLTRMMH